LFLALREVVRGPRGRVTKYVRQSDRCPAEVFLGGCQKPMQRRFEGAFLAIVNDLGARAYNEQRFKPLQGDGRPLWEFKEHDHRLYCLKTGLEGDRVEIVLLSGWVKDKRGKTDEERRQIRSAKMLLSEYLAEEGKGK
jgi:hypothetical protein